MLPSEVPPEYLESIAMEFEKPKPERRLPEVEVGDTVVLWRNEPDGSKLEGGWIIRGRMPNEPHVFYLDNPTQGSPVVKRITATEAEVKAANDTVRTIDTWVDIAREMGVKVHPTEELKIAQRLNAPAYARVNIHVAKAEIFEHYPRDTSQNHTINKALETLEDLHDKRFPKPPETIKPLETRLAEAKVQNGDKNIIVKSPDTGAYEGGWAVTGEVFNTANRQEQMFVVSKDNITFPIPVQEIQKANKLIRTVNEWVRFGNEVGVAVNSRDPVYIQNQGALDREMAADEACKMFRKGRQNLDRMTQLATVMASLQERQAEIENQ